MPWKSGCLIDFQLVKFTVPISGFGDGVTVPVPLTFVFVVDAVNCHVTAPELALVAELLTGN